MSSSPPGFASDLPKPSLEDRIAIADIIAGLGMHTDQCEWDRVEAGLAPEVMTDYVSLFGGSPQKVTRSELVANYRSRLPGFDASQHMISTVEIGMLGADRAISRSYVRATHRLGKELLVLGGLYTHELIKSSHGWLVSSIVFSLYYEEGDRKMVERAAERAAKVVS
jgi:hypothetical protein